MRNKLICYVNSIFEGIPNTPEVQELREEILQNTLDRYDEECARGVSETVAYNVAVMSIGDTDELLAAYRKPKKEKKSSRRVCVAIAIALYILCVVPPAVADEMGWPEALGVSLMFLMIAAATALIILSGGREKPAAPKASAPQGVPVQPAAQPVQAASAQEERSSAVKILRGVLTPLYWLAAVGLFLAAGFAGYWYVAWVIFIAAGAVGDVITGIVYMAKGRYGLKKFIEGLMLLAAVAIYLKISAASGAWVVTWLVFPICAALTGVLSGIFTLATGGKQ
jgi:fatty acid desaturase